MSLSETTYPQFETTTEQGFNYGGYGGLLVAEHYRKVQAQQEAQAFYMKKRQIAPKLGTEKYFDWLRKQGATMDFTLLRPPERPRIEEPAQS